LAPLVWLETPKETFAHFQNVRENSSSSANAQRCKAVPGIGSGVFRDRHNGTTRRPTGTVLAVQLGEKIYVLHAFQKNPRAVSRRPIEEGGGNVFADLGLKDSDEVFCACANWLLRL